MLLFVVEIIIMILAIILGLHTGALGCGIFAIVAQLIMIFGFQLPPGSAPVTAVLIILSIGIAVVLYKLRRNRLFSLSCF